MNNYFNDAEASTGKLKAKLNQYDVSVKVDALNRVLAVRI